MKCGRGPHLSGANDVGHFVVNRVLPRFPVNPCLVETIGLFRGLFGIPQCDYGKRQDA